MQPVHSGSLEQNGLVQYSQIENLSTSTQPIFISPKDGSISIVADTAFNSSESFHLSSTILHIAADLLEERTIKSEHKQYKKTAKRMIDFYTRQFKEINHRKLSSEEKKALSLDFRSIGKNYGGKACEKALEKALKDGKELDVKLLEFANQYGVFSSKEVSALFAGRGALTDVPDFIRHVLSGIVDIVVDGANINTLAAIANTDFSGNTNEQEQLKMLTERTALILDVFADKAAFGTSQHDQDELKREIRALLDEMINQKTSDFASTCFETRVNSVWKSSTNSALARICKLIHLLNQTYTLSTGKVTCYHTKDLTKSNSNCPYKLLNLENFELERAKEGFKKINIQFIGNQIQAQHICKFQQVGGSLTVDQTVELKACLDDLDKWEFSQSNLINVPTNEKTDNAAKIHRYWKLYGIKSTMTA